MSRSNASSSSTTSRAMWVLVGPTYSRFLIKSRKHTSHTPTEMASIPKLAGT